MEIPIGTGVLGQYLIDVSLVNPETGKIFDNVLEDPLSFEFMSIDEYAGFRLPVMLFRFQITKYAIFAFLNQGNVVKVVLNRGGTDHVNYEMDFQILEPKILSDGNLKKAELKCILNVPDFNDLTRRRSFRGMNSMEVFYAVASNHFIPDFGTVPPDDTQNWVQWGVSDKQFCVHLFQHTNYEESFPITAITAQGEFRHRDFLSHVSRSEYDWGLISSEASKPSEELQDLSDEDTKQKSKYIIHAGDLRDVSKSGILNKWRGNGVIVPIYKMVNGGPPIPYEGRVRLGAFASNGEERTGVTPTETEEDSDQPKKVANRRYSSEPNYINTEYDAGNAFSSFYEVKARNIFGSTLYSSQEIALTLEDLNFHTIRVLDLVYLEEPDTVWDDDQQEGEQKPNYLSSNRYSQGFYLVSRVSRLITGGRIQTRVELCRDAPAEQQGFLR